MIRLSAEQRSQLIDRYERNIQALEDVCADVPDEAWQFRPQPGEWTIHENICHCADVDQLAAIRMKMIATEPHLPIIGIEQDLWAAHLGYHAIPVEVAFATIRAVRTFTADQLRSLPDSAWSHVAQHNEQGEYTLEDWLEYFSRHPLLHVAQIQQTLRAFERR